MALATPGRNCAGNATDHDMHSTIVASFSRGTGVLEAMADLSDDIENFMRCTATEHASTQESLELFTNSVAKEVQVLASLLCNQMNCYRAFSWKRHWLPATQLC